MCCYFLGLSLCDSAVAAAADKALADESIMQDSAAAPRQSMFAVLIAEIVCMLQQ